MEIKTIELRTNINLEKQIKKMIGKELKKNRNEKNLVVLENKNILAFITLKYSNPDYLFFYDSYILIKELILNNQNLYKVNPKLIIKNILEYINDLAKKENIKYICMDIEDENLKLILEENSMKVYRNRLCKNLKERI